MSRKDRETELTSTVQMTVTIDKATKNSLELRARAANTTPNKIIAMLLRRHVLGEEQFWDEIAKERAGKLAEAQYARDQARDRRLMEALAAQEGDGR